VYHEESDPFSFPQQAITFEIAVPTSASYHDAGSDDSFDERYRTSMCFALVPIFGVARVHPCTMAAGLKVRQLIVTRRTAKSHLTIPLGATI
jgi:hypothetical protein